jgi:hypothetical protein
MPDKTKESNCLQYSFLPHYSNAVLKHVQCLALELRSLSYMVSLCVCIFKHKAVEIITVLIYSSISMALMHPDPRVPAPSLRICSLLILFPHGSICYLKSFNARSIMLRSIREFMFL